MDDSVLVKVEKRDGWGELVLNRPERRNALTTDLVIQLHGGLDDCIADDRVAAILVRGEGGCLCAGLDLKEVVGNETQRLAFGPAWTDLHLALAGCPKPTIAVLEGAAVAAGSALALACDFLVAGRRSVLHVSEVSRGMTAPMNVAWIVAKHGRARALELVVAAGKHDGEDLFGLGMATRVADDDEVLGAARALAGQLVGHDGAAVAGSKAMIDKASAEGFAEALSRIRAEAEGPQ